MWQTMLCVGFGGALGSMLRWLTTRTAQSLFGAETLSGTVIVNAVGCLLIGLFAPILQRRAGGSVELYALIVTGFLGGLTTFSTFAYETARQFEAQRLSAGLGNLLLQNVLGVILVLIGLSIGVRLSASVNS